MSRIMDMLAGSKQQIWAQHKLGHAVKRGAVIRCPCEVCGDVNSEAHHDDYSKPLDVRWLCRLHHRQFHASYPVTHGWDNCRTSIGNLRLALFQYFGFVANSPLRLWAPMLNLYMGLLSMKQCSGCLKMLSSDAFYVCKGGHLAKQSWCKQCKSKSQSSWYERNRAKIRAQQAEYYRKRASAKFIDL